MKGTALSLLTAILVGFATVAAVATPAQADGGVEYRIIGCDAIQASGGPPNFVEPDPEFLVVISTSPDDIGQLCETVLASLVNKGLKIIEIRNGTANSSFTGIYHYLELRSGDG